jgi:hypothetical protein
LSMLLIHRAAAAATSCIPTTALHVVLLLQVELYEHAQILGNLMSKGPVPGVETYCIYGENRVPD